MDGEEINFTNEKWCIENESDERFEMTVLFRNERKNTWANGFKIWFNGKIVETPKRFKTLESKVNHFIVKYNLEVVTEFLLR